MLQQRYTAPELAQGNVDRKPFFANEMQKSVGEIIGEFLNIDGWSSALPLMPGTGSRKIDIKF